MGLACLETLTLAALFQIIHHIILLFAVYASLTKYPEQKYEMREKSGTSPGGGLGCVVRGWGVVEVSLQPRMSKLRLIPPSPTCSHVKFTSPSKRLYRAYRGDGDLNIFDTLCDAGEEVELGLVKSRGGFSVLQGQSWFKSDCNLHQRVQSYDMWSMVSL